MHKQLTPRLDSLTGLRWYAAFAVFGFHSLQLIPLPFHLNVILNEGYFGVTFFFILSGFVLTWSSKSNVSISTFYVRRFGRIFPLHFVALLLAIPVFYSLNPNPADWWVKDFSLWMILVSLFLLQGWSRDETILFSGNPASWTLSCEAFFYFMHPFLGRVFSRVRQRGALCLAFGALGLMSIIQFINWLDQDSAINLVPLTILRLPEFFIGMCLAWGVRSGLRTRMNFPISLGFLGAIILLLIMRHIYPDSVALKLVFFFREELMVIGFSLLILAAARIDISHERTHLRSLPLQKLGEWSYAFYLTHGTLLYLLRDIFGQASPRLLNFVWFVILLIVSIAIAGLAHHFIEKPAESWIRKWKDSRDKKSAYRVEKNVPK